MDGLALSQYRMDLQGERDGTGWKWTGLVYVHAYVLYFTYLIKAII